MEDIKKYISNCIDSIDNFERECNEIIKISLLKVDEICQPSDKFVTQNTKKQKRLEPICDDSESSVTSTIDNTLENSNHYQSSRPVRSAKLRILNNLKEKPLNHKLRRPSLSNDKGNQNTDGIKVKIEKLSGISENNNKQNQEKIMVIENFGEKKEFDKTSKKTDNSIELIEVNSVVELSDEDLDKMPPPVQLPLKTRVGKRNKNIFREKEISSAAIKVEKQSLDGNQVKEAVVRLERIKQERNSDSFKSTSLGSSGKSVISKKGKKGKKAFKHVPIKEELVEKSVNKKFNSDKENAKPLENIVSENEQIIRKSARNLSKKNQTSSDSVYEDAVSGNNNRKDSNNSNKSDKSIKNVVVKLKKKNLLSDITAKEKDVDKLITVDNPGNDTQMKNTITLARNMFVVPIALKSTISETINSVIDKCNATFNMPTKSGCDAVLNMPPTENDGGCDATFNVPQTQNDGGCDATFNVPQTQNNGGYEATFNVTTSKKDDVGSKIINDSLMTDDESQEDDLHIDIILNKEPLKTKFSKKKIELFSPFVQSPVKMKVKAFEKHANATEVMASPIPQRQTRTKTKLKQQKEESEKNKYEEINQKQKNTTPSILPQLRRVFTPTLQNVTTPTQANICKKAAPNSTSKMQALQKAISSTSLASSKGSSLSNENCSNDKLQNKTKLNQIVEEKKRMREMKAQMVLKVKEQKEKERQERLRKQIEEKEEKQRKLELEKRNLEEMQKQLKLMDENQRKYEKQKQLEHEKILLEQERFRKDKDIQEKIEKNKQKLIFKQNQKFYEHQQQLLMQQQIHQKQKNNMTPKEQHHFPSLVFRYDFDMLHSDDSTDDEGKSTTKRPRPPAWSRSIVRQPYIEKQTYIPTHIIDNFFSVQPTTPDLREIFPAIDPKYLKRNSSVVWKTPPRYSTLPKY